jgi:hypothetical protein
MNTRHITEENQQAIRQKFQLYLQDKLSKHLENFDKGKPFENSYLISYDYGRPLLKLMINKLTSELEEEIKKEFEEIIIQNSSDKNCP